MSKAVTTYNSAVITAGSLLADETQREIELENERAAIKLAAIQRIMASGDNQLTGKAHSFSSAEAVVHTDKAYSAHLARCAEQAAARIRARAEYDAAVIAGFIAANRA